MSPSKFFLLFFLLFLFFPVTLSLTLSDLRAKTTIYFLHLQLLLTEKFEFFTTLGMGACLYDPDSIPNWPSRGSISLQPLHDLLHSCHSDLEQATLDYENALANMANRKDPHDTKRLKTYSRHVRTAYQRMLEARQKYNAAVLSLVRSLPPVVKMAHAVRDAKDGAYALLNSVAEAMEPTAQGNNMYPHHRPWRIAHLWRGGEQPPAEIAFPPLPSEEMEPTIKDGKERMDAYLKTVAERIDANPPGNKHPSHRKAWEIEDVLRMEAQHPSIDDPAFFPAAHVVAGDIPPGIGGANANIAQPDIGTSGEIRGKADELWMELKIGAVGFGNYLVDGEWDANLLAIWEAMEHTARRLAERTALITNTENSPRWHMFDDATKELVKQARVAMMQMEANLNKERNSFLEGVREAVQRGKGKWLGQLIPQDLKPVVDVFLKGAAEYTAAVKEGLKIVDAVYDSVSVDNVFAPVGNNLHSRVTYLWNRDKSNPFINFFTAPFTGFMILTTLALLLLVYLGDYFDIFGQVSFLWMRLFSRQRRPTEDEFTFTRRRNRVRPVSSTGTSRDAARQGNDRPTTKGTKTRSRGTKQPVRRDAKRTAAVYNTPIIPESVNSETPDSSQYSSNTEEANIKHSKGKNAGQRASRRRPAVELVSPVPAKEGRDSDQSAEKSRPPMTRRKPAPSRRISGIDPSQLILPETPVRITRSLSKRIRTTSGVVSSTGRALEAKEK